MVSELSVFQSARFLHHLERMSLAWSARRHQWSVMDVHHPSHELEVLSCTREAKMPQRSHVLRNSVSYCKNW